MHDHNLKGKTVVETAKYKAMKLQEHISKKVLIDRDIYYSFQTEIKTLNNHINKLKSDRDQLKNALAEAISKRDIHYNQYQHYKSLYESLKTPSTSFQSSIPKLDLSAKSDHSTKSLKLASKNSQSKELYKEINKIEGKLLKNDIDSISWKDLYNSSRFINEEAQSLASTFSDKIYTSSLRILSKIKQDQILYNAFKQVSRCSKYFITLIDSKMWDEALFNLLEYLELLLSNYKFETIAQRTPSFSPRGQLGSKSCDNASKKSLVAVFNAEVSVENEPRQQSKSPIQRSLKIPRVYSRRKAN